LKQQSFNFLFYRNNLTPPFTTRPSNGAHASGRPKDGDWRAGYVLLEVGDRPVVVEFPRVEYDIDSAMRAIRKSDLPDVATARSR
jgi:diadenosine tetraphosphatase ApaH/serine/threonine PP2A family protein phosphatase